MNDPLSFENFLTGARRFLGLAMAARAREDHELFAMNAGITIERIAKAALMRRNPALLVEMKGSSEMLLYLTGMKEARKIRTIGMTEAISRLRQGGVLPHEDPKLDLLVELRNGVAHSAGVEMTDDLLPTFARVVDILLEDVGEDRDSFWGNWSTAANLAASESRDEISQDVLIRIQNARYLFEDKIPGLPRGAFAKYEPLDPRYPEHVQVVLSPNGMTYTTTARCPACEGQAEEKKIVMLQDISGESAAVTTRLACKYCRLALHGSEEMEVAGFHPVRHVDLTEDSALATAVRELISEPKGRIKDSAGQEWRFPDLRKKESWQEIEPDDVGPFWPVLSKYGRNSAGETIFVRTIIVR
jgi:hypothetical protein